MNGLLATSCVFPLVRSAERSFHQANWITLTKSCRRDNSSGDHFAYRLGLTGVAQLFEGSFESFAHRRNHLGFKHSGLYERTNWHSDHFPREDRTPNCAGRKLTCINV
jgi:hypothetical protein